MHFLTNDGPRYVGQGRPLSKVSQMTEMLVKSKHLTKIQTQPVCFVACSLLLTGVQHCNYFYKKFFPNLITMLINEKYTNRRQILANLGVGPVQ